MKTTYIITALLFCLTALSQNHTIPINDSLAKAEAKKHDRFTISVNTEPNAFIKDGFNFGADIEHYNKNLYFGVGVYLFPNLNDVGYSQFHFTFGLNLISKNEKRRAYFGGLGGFSIRDGGPFTVFAVESGIEFYLTKNIGFGVEGQVMNRASETRFYGNKEWIFNGAFKLIYRWK